jgi:hypothetical protein
MSTKLLIGLLVEAYRGIVAIFDHICNDECVLAVAFGRGIVTVFLVLFDEMGIYENSLKAFG